MKTFRIYFEPRDIWVGLYWKRTLAMNFRVVPVYTFYLCLFPCFPIVWEVRGKPIDAELI